MSEGIFNRLANEVLEASEQIVNRFEEGYNVLTTGELKPDQGSQPPPAGATMGSIPNMDDADLDSLSEEDLQRLLEEHLMDSSPLEGIADSVLGDIVSRQVGPSTPMEHFDAFRSAITWSETFILALVGFQIVMFLLTFWVSRKDRGLTPRITVMVLIFIVVRSAEWLNQMGNTHWQSFATQNYFDRKGIFVGIMLCGPLIVDCLMMLLSFVAEAGQLLVQVKKRELKQKKRKTKDESKSTGRAKTKKHD